MDYIRINQNDFLHRKHKKHREEDVAICVCKCDANDPDSACGETCLNVLTSTECTSGYCPCGVCCNNQEDTYLWEDDDDRRILTYGKMMMTAGGYLPTGR